MGRVYPPLTVFIEVNAFNSTKKVFMTFSDQSKSTFLKLSILATGFSGLVAEYVMATLASYLLGDAVVQYSLMITFMLFSMAIGSGISKFIPDKHVLKSYIGAEIGIAWLTSLAAIFCYVASTFVSNFALLIYLMGISIGILIGLEIPLVTRLNGKYEIIRVNVSRIMQYDYFGSLIGGLFFVFVALSYLGMTYTPPLVGSVNLLAAILLIFAFRNELSTFGFRSFVCSIGVTFFLILGVVGFSRPIILYGEQTAYDDTIIEMKQSKYQRIVVTKWKSDYWLYLDRDLQFSTLDEERYHEPLVHPAMELSKSPKNVLMLGGGDGMAAREVLKHNPDSLVVVDLDPVITKMGKNYEPFLKHNEGSLNDPRVTVLNRDAWKYIEKTDMEFDAVIIDLPDPKKTAIARLYTKKFYGMIKDKLDRKGVVVTQATSPFYAGKAYFSIWKTFEYAGYSAVGYHTHVKTMGEWGWVIAQPGDVDIEREVKDLSFENYKRRYIDSEIMRGMMAWGKETEKLKEMVSVNTVVDLSTYRYYHSGRWDIY